MRRNSDAITGKAEWGLVTAPTGGIMGVHSLSEATRLKTGGFDETDGVFEGKRRYSEWQFTYTPPEPPGAPASATLGTRPVLPR
jgi:hypothetical protein